MRVSNNFNLKSLEDEYMQPDVMGAATSSSIILASVDLLLASRFGLPSASLSSILMPLSRLF